MECEGGERRGEESGLREGVHEGVWEGMGVSGVQGRRGPVTTFNRGVLISGVSFKRGSTVLLENFVNIQDLKYACLIRCFIPEDTCFQVSY